MGIDAEIYSEEPKGEGGAKSHQSKCIKSSKAFDGNTGNTFRCTARAQRVGISEYSPFLCGCGLLLLAARAGDGSRTRLNSLEGYRTTDVLRPRFCAIILS